MTISMYQMSVPVFQHMLTNLVVILNKGEAHAAAKKINPEVLINSRLYPDMLPFVRQIQIAADTAKGCAARLAGIEPPKYQDNEETFPELAARINKTLKYLETFQPEQVDGSEQRAITLKMRDHTVNLVGQQYLLNMALPNFYFHVTTAYDILRHCGVELGKKDFIGTP